MSDWLGVLLCLAYGLRRYRWRFWSDWLENFALFWRVGVIGVVVRDFGLIGLRVLLYIVACRGWNLLLEILG